MLEVRLPVEVVRGVPVVTAPEEIDITNAAALRAALLQAAAHGRGTVIADMSGTQFCDSAGLHVLVRAHKRAQAEGGELLLVIPATTVLRVFAITGIDRMIPSFSSLEDALAAHLPPPAGLPAATQATRIKTLTGPSRPGSRKPAATAAPLLDLRRTAPVTDLQHATGPVVVHLPDEIDMANAERAGEQLRSAFTRGAAVVIADLTPTVFCDCAGARQLLLAHNYADAHGAQVRFVIPDRGVLRVLTLTGLDELLSIYPSLDAAVSAGPALTGDAASG